MDEPQKPLFNVGGRLTKQHGAEGCLKRLQRGQPFIGLALEIQHEVEASLGINPDSLSGIERVLVDAACRLETTARLFQAAAYGAAETGDLDRWEGYSQRLGWITGKAFAALKEIRDMVEERPRVVDYEVLLREAGDE